MVTPEQIVDQFQQIVATLKRTIEASADLAERVDALERNSGQALGMLTSLQGNLQVLLDTYSQQSAEQQQTLAGLAGDVAALKARLEAVEGR